MPVFNAFEATHPRKRKAHTEARITKPPVSPASATKEELKEMAARAGWQVRELTFDEVQRMSSSELRFHEVWNRAALDRAFQVERDKRVNQERESIWNVRKTLTILPMALSAGFTSFVILHGRGPS